MIKFWHKELSNISDKAKIGEDTVVHAGVQIHDGVIIGKNCQIEAQVFIPKGVIIENEVFVGPQVCFTNDRDLKGSRETWSPILTLVGSGARIGANVTIRAGVTIGKDSVIGCGSVVLHDVLPNTTVAGNPAKEIWPTKKSSQT